MLGDPNNLSNLFATLEDKKLQDTLKQPIAEENPAQSTVTDSDIANISDQIVKMGK